MQMREAGAVIVANQGAIIRSSFGLVGLLPNILGSSALINVYIITLMSNDHIDKYFAGSLKISDALV